MTNAISCLLLVLNRGHHGGSPLHCRMSRYRAAQADAVITILPTSKQVVEAIGGTGKSALTWQWAEERAETAVSGLAGRLWWREARRN